MELKSTGVRKRQQLAKANRTMFLYVAGVSVVVGFAAVGSLFLGQKIIFGEKVLIEKNKTVSALEQNLEEAPKLSDNVRALATNQNLLATRAQDDDSALQSILDALPADANSTALGSSLQSKLLSGVNGVALDAIRVEPVSGAETDTSTDGDSTGSNQISFTFTVSADSSNATALQEVLRRLERSIRAIDVTNVTIETQGRKLLMSASATAYYQPAKTIQLTEKVVKP